MRCTPEGGALAGVGWLPPRRRLALAATSPSRLLRFGGRFSGSAGAAALRFLEPAAAPRCRRRCAGAAPAGLRGARLGALALPAPAWRRAIVAGASRSLLPLVGDGADHDEHAERQAEVDEGRAARAVGERHRLAVARRETVGVGRLEAAGDALEQRLGVELEQARIAAHHAAREGAARQRRELLLLERLELARRELELLRDLGEREPARLARCASAAPTPQ